MLNLIIGSALFLIGTSVGGGIYAIGAEEVLKVARKECAWAKGEDQFCKEDCM